MKSRTPAAALPPGSITPEKLEARRTLDDWIEEYARDLPAGFATGLLVSNAARLAIQCGQLTREDFLRVSGEIWDDWEKESN